MKPDFLRIDDALQRLNRCIVFYNAVPVFVEQSMEPLKLSIRSLAGHKPAFSKTVDFNDEKFDLGAPELGYVNQDATTFFFQRVPVRKVLQGICWDNLNCIPDNRFGHNLYNAPGFYKMLMNIYPSLDEAASEIEKGNAESMAFHRLFALAQGTAGIILKYRAETIGAYNRKTGSINLLSSDNASFIARLFRQHFPLLAVVGY